MIDQISLALIKLALKEDLGEKNIDITTAACIESSLIKSAIIIAKESGIFFGNEIACEVFNQVDENILYKPILHDGEAFKNGDIIAKITGPFSSILTAERTVLNFIQRLSGVATMTSKVVAIVSNKKLKILDSRKTTPGFRALEKQAVVAGGGYNHRIGLYDAFLIKNNHIDALNGDLVKAIEACRKFDEKRFLKVEVRNMKELVKALSCNPDGILLDNFSISALQEAVVFVRSNESYQNIVLEASGGINLNNLKEYSETGIDEISMGMLTHSIKSIDFSLRFDDDKI